MIGLLKGTLIMSQPPHLMMMVSGVGYELLAPMPTFYKLPEVGAEVTLYTYLVVREDAHTLFGFTSSRDKMLFKELIKANGVGPKLALAILSGIGCDEFVHSILESDVTALVRIPGIGKKTAERLVIELADRFKDWTYLSGHVEANDSSETSVAFTLGASLVDGRQAAEVSSDEPTLTQHQLRTDAESALIALGYKPQEAAKAVKGVLAVGLSREEVIRLALQSMVKRTVTI